MRVHPPAGGRLVRAVIHPDLDLRPLDLSAPGRAPSRPCRDQNNGSTAPGSMDWEKRRNGGRVFNYIIIALREKRGSRLQLYNYRIERKAPI
jgi:hypothetical protein